MDNNIIIRSWVVITIKIQENNNICEIIRYLKRIYYIKIYYKPVTADNKLTTVNKM